MEKDKLLKNDIENEVEKDKKKEKKNIKSKIKEFSELKDDEQIVFTFKFDEKMRRKITTIIVLIVLIACSFFIKYPEKTIEIFGDLSKEELNSVLHMDNVLIYPDYDDILNNKSVFENENVYSEAIVLEKVRESDECYKLKVTFDPYEEKIGYLYYTENSKDIILLNEKITFIGKVTNVNKNKDYIDFEVLRLDTGNGFFSEKDMNSIAEIYTSDSNIKVENTTESIDIERDGSGYKNYCFDINKAADSKFPNKIRIIDAKLHSDIIDSTSTQKETYTRIDVNETGDKFIKMKKDFKRGIFSLEVYNKFYEKIFDKSWKNMSTENKFAYDYVSRNGNFYINIENVIYIFNEETGAETKIDVSGKGYIDVDYKGYIYYLSLEEGGYVTAFSPYGRQICKENLISKNDTDEFEVRDIVKIYVTDYSNLVAEFKASKVYEDSKGPEEYECVKLKAKSGIRIDDTL